MQSPSVQCSLVFIIIMLPNQAIASTPSAPRPSGAEGTITHIPSLHKILSNTPRNHPAPPPTTPNIIRHKTQQLGRSISLVLLFMTSLQCSVVCLHVHFMRFSRIHYSMADPVYRSVQMDLLRPDPVGRALKMNTGLVLPNSSDKSAVEYAVGCSGMNNFRTHHVLRLVRL
jgi:hypothetical protein